jgi:adenylate cyclase
MTDEVRGDALVAEFQKASDAITAALAFQREQADLQPSELAGKVPAIRIGISMGEVIVADDTVTGAGVVLAQRLEQLAEPGGVVIQGAVRQAVPGRMPFRYKDLGELPVKGFDDLVAAYRVTLLANESLPQPEAGPLATRRPSVVGRRHVIGSVSMLIGLAAVALIMTWKPWRIEDVKPAADTIATKATVDSRPVIAVLPLENMSDDPEQRYFSDGVSSDLITDLSRVSGLAVIARQTSFAYRDDNLEAGEFAGRVGASHVVVGSVRRQGLRIRVNVALIDAEKNLEVWAERYDRELDDIFGVQDEITQQVVESLLVTMTGEEKRNIHYRATDSFAAYDLFLQGQRLFGSGTRQGIEQSKSAYRRAIELDPRFARAYSALGVAITRQVLRGWSEAPVEVRKRAQDLVDKAMSLDPLSPDVQWARGFVSLYNHDHDIAVESARRCVELAPSYADGYGLLALISNWRGENENAIDYAERGIRLDPRHTWDFPYNIGRALYELGDHDSAEAHLLEALHRNPAALPAQIFLMANYARAGKLEDAEWQAEQLEVTNPELTISHYAQSMPFGNEEQRAYVVRDLRLAGLRE